MFFVFENDFGPAFRFFNGRVGGMEMADLRWVAMVLDCIGRGRR